MKRWTIQIVAGALGIALVVTAAACGRRAEQRPAGALTAATPSSSPPRTTPPPVAGAWNRLSAAPIAGPYILASVWTGKEMLTFGRVMSEDSGGDVDVAAAYDPATDTWRALTAGPDREGSYEGTDRAVWTGSEMLVWGITDKAFDPATDRWRRLPDPPLNWGGPAVTVWTGNQMIGWGGGCCDDNVGDGLAYTPATNSWEKLPSGPLAGRQAASGAWTGTELVIAGGGAEGKIFSDAAAYNPITHTWRQLPDMPQPRSGATSTWDGTEVLFVGGGNGRLSADGTAYDPAANRWRQLPAMGSPREGHVAVWTGNQLLVWGGRSGEGNTAARPPHGEAYDPAADSWSPLPVSPLRGRVGAAGIWTGTAMILWGGIAISPDPSQPLADGAAYTPGTR